MAVPHSGEENAHSKLAVLSAPFALTVARPAVPAVNRLGSLGASARTAPRAAIASRVKAGDGDDGRSAQAHVSTSAANLWFGQDDAER
jgi:hypothetical protein